MVPMAGITTRILLFVPMVVVCSGVFAQEPHDDLYDDYYDFGISGGITIFGERPSEYASESTEANILSALNGSPSDRKNFIENDLLHNAGFRSTANLRYRRTDGTEKALSVLHGIGRVLSFGIVPMKPFFEVDYGRLPNGVYFSFETVISSSELNDISPDVLAVMKIEYKLQIEFGNGFLSNSNRNYYTQENINRFEMLILDLPELPESIGQLKERYLNNALPAIKRSFERHNNPGDDWLQALENLGIAPRGQD